MEPELLRFLVFVRQAEKHAQAEASVQRQVEDRSNAQVEDLAARCAQAEAELRYVTEAAEREAKTAIRQAHERATQAVSQQLQAERASASEQAEQACHDRYTAQLREAEARHAAELEAAAASGGAAAVAEARREAHQVRNPFS